MTIPLLIKSVPITHIFFYQTHSTREKIQKVKEQIHSNIPDKRERNTKQTELYIMMNVPKNTKYVP